MSKVGCLVFVDLKKNFFSPCLKFHLAAGWKRSSVDSQKSVMKTPPSSAAVKRGSNSLVILVLGGFHLFGGEVQDNLLQSSLSGLHPVLVGKLILEAAKTTEWSKVRSHLQFVFSEPEWKSLLYFTSPRLLITKSHHGLANTLVFFFSLLTRGWEVGL